MGRASRIKAETRAARLGRWVSIYNPKTEHFELFRVTISDQGLDDWIIHREELSERGYPDRPPVYDDEIVRSWDPATSSW